MNKITHSSMTSSWQLLRASTTLVRLYIEPVIVLALLPTLLLQLGTLFSSMDASLGRVVYLTGALWLFVSAPALLWLELRAAQHEPVTIGTAYRQGMHFFLRILGVGILTSICITFGLILFIIPGFVLIRRYALAPFYVIDKDMSVLAAMRQSASDSKPAASYIWGSLGVVLFVSIISIVVGLVFSFIPGIPGVITTFLSLMGMFVLALRYREVAQVRSDTPSSNS